MRTGCGDLGCGDLGMLKAVADARSTKRRRTDIVDDALRQPLVGRRKRKSRELKGKIFVVIQNKPGPGMGGAPLKTSMPVSYTAP